MKQTRAEPDLEGPQRFRGRLRGSKPWGGLGGAGKEEGGEREPRETRVRQDTRKCPRRSTVLFLGHSILYAEGPSIENCHFHGMIS